MSTCKSCGAPVTWVLTTKGKRMPLDAVPVATGNVTVEDGYATVHAAIGLFVAPGPRYVSHFATCPQANQHRTPRSSR